MDHANTGGSHKRGFVEFQVGQLAHKLRSKEDFYTYLDQHRKCLRSLSSFLFSQVLPAAQGPGEQRLFETSLHE